jgi:hypothetical protein
LQDAANFTRINAVVNPRHVIAILLVVSIPIGRGVFFFSDATHSQKVQNASSPIRPLCEPRIPFPTFPPLFGTTNTYRTTSTIEHNNLKRELEVAEATAYAKDPLLKSLESYRETPLLWLEQHYPRELGRMMVFTRSLGIGTVELKRFIRLRHLYASLSFLEFHRSGSYPFLEAAYETWDELNIPMPPFTLEMVDQALGQMEATPYQNVTPAAFVAYLEQREDQMLTQAKLLESQIHLPDDLVESVRAKSAVGVMTTLVDVYLQTMTPRRVTELRKAVRGQNN